MKEIRQEKEQLDHWGFNLPTEKEKVVCAVQAEKEKSAYRLIPFPFWVAGTEHYIRWLLLK